MPPNPAVNSDVPVKVFVPVNDIGGTPVTWFRQAASNPLRMSITIFQSRRLRCRQWNIEDFQPLFAVYSDPEAMRWVGDGEPITREECAKWMEVTQANYETRGYGMFAFEDIASGQVIGFGGLVHPGGQAEPEIKYAFLRSYWAKGLASEAIPQLLTYGASAHGLTKIIATVAPENLASQRVLTKAGMTLSERRNNGDGSVTNVYEWHAQDAA